MNYWDYIGHKDLLASEKNTHRQRRYAKVWKSSNIYTPGFVKNGKVLLEEFLKKIVKM